MAKKQVAAKWKAAFLNWEISQIEEELAFHSRYRLRAKNRAEAARNEEERNAWRTDRRQLKKLIRRARSASDPLNRVLAFFALGLRAGELRMGGLLADADRGRGTVKSGSKGGGGRSESFAR